MKKVLLILLFIPLLMTACSSNKEDVKEEPLKKLTCTKEEEGYVVQVNADDSTYVTTTTYSYETEEEAIRDEEYFRSIEIANEINRNGKTIVAVSNGVRVEDETLEDVKNNLEKTGFTCK